MRPYGRCVSRQRIGTRIDAGIGAHHWTSHRRGRCRSPWKPLGRVNEAGRRSERYADVEAPQRLSSEIRRSVIDADEQLGHPIVSNGLPLTRIQHAALFDVHQIGIDPDFRIHALIGCSKSMMVRFSNSVSRGSQEVQSTGRDGLRTVPIATGWRFVSRVIRERGIVSISIGLRRMRSKKRRVV